LCGNRKRAVFRKATRVAQVGNVFSRSAKAKRVAFGNRFGAVKV
jgi:hypothetical protein